MASEHEKNLVEILGEDYPIDINKYTNFVHSPQCGAIATFFGNTRDTFDGKTVVELRYEAYVPMAMRCLNTICSSARSLWNLNAIAVAHRLGRVSVGETSVFVAVSSVHRVDALDACKFVIDEIKASVPIWKKEVYSNGEVWKENLEFLERRPEIGNSRGCCRPKVKVESEEVAAPVKNSCCRPKVKVEDDGSVKSGNDNP
uniref:molybdopterin synthase catalytic subunit n=1 Tax=Erigeron canadensis TaxID=72917 RepID=UPI001CB9495D|nr:molybdopterin synthase catalytic subunit [Erigeron canadensis]XP_043624967.1 molybdopterin synthase catalytic subunit [Erigeron canadensis]